MAVPSGDAAVPAQKGDSINVEVVDSIRDAIVIKFVGLDKVFHGVLLQDDSSFNQYGINLDRVRGAPFWPPSTVSTGVNLKTIPCSTERYSYKHEGQPSTLNVFQPEVIKRGTRHQPAPQLSRILRPRRFVCRKCKKAYHIEENGVEMSSETLPLQTDSIAADSSAFVCDVESAHVNTGVQSDNKYSHRSNTTPPSDGDGLSQSIRQVTPPIMPKLTEDYALNGRDSEVDSNSDDTTVKRAKLIVKEKVITSLPSADKISVSAKRKADPPSLCQRQKKLKRSSEPSTKYATEKLPSAAPKSDPERALEGVAVSSSVTSDEKQCPTVLDHLKPTDHASLSLSVSKDATIRKNRIKAQYVSVATPFRFPPSRSSKPDLLSGNQFTSSFSREKSNASHKGNMHRTSTLSATCGKIPENVKVVTSDPSLSSAENIKPAQPEKAIPSSSQGSVRHRFRALSVQHAVSHTKRINQKERDLSTISESDDVVISQPPASESTGQSVNTQEEVLVVPDTRHTSVDDELTTTTLPAPMELSSTDSSSTVASSQPATTKDPSLLTSRARAVDYEKPKNRWIREARARRSCEERSSSISLSTNLNITPPTSTLTGNPSESSIEHPNSSLFRLRSRSSEGTQILPSTGTAPSKTGSVSKKRIAIHAEGSSSNQTASVSDNITQPDRTFSSHVRNSSQTSDSTALGLPVLKIKINRQSQPSSGANSFAHYEVIELPVPNESEVSGGQAALDVTSTLSKSDSTSLYSVDEVADVKGDTNSNELCSSPLSRKDSCSANSPGLGYPVKRCHLPDGVTFRVGDLVWSKLSGWPSWPAQITSIHRVPSDDAEPTAPSTEYDFTDDLQSRTESSPSSKRFSYTACLHWFAWHQVSYMPCDKLFHFLQHYKRFDNKKKRGIFRHAVNEAKQKSEEKQLNPPSSSDSDSGDGALSEFPTQEVHIPAISHTTATTERTSPSPEAASALPAESSVLNLPTPVATSASVQGSSTPSLPCTKLCSRPYSNSTTTRTRPPNRGRLRSLRGRRGGSVGCVGRTRSSPRNLPTFLPSGLQPVDNPNTSNNLPVLRLTIPSAGRKFFRGRHRSFGRGRGSVSSRESLDATSLSSTLPPRDVTAVHSVASTGTLKMVLSASKFRVPKCQNSGRKSLTEKQPRRGGKSCSVRGRSRLRTTQASLFTPQPATQCISSIDVPKYQPNNVVLSGNCHPSELDLPSHTNYDDPPSEILSQFPQVFPDLRASGILPNSVDIPTFSEDESEEEDSRRLIIDPDVMASVNASGSSSSIDCFRQSESIALQGGFCPPPVSIDSIALGSQLRTDTYLSLNPSEFEHLSHGNLPDSVFSATPVPTVSCSLHPHSGFSTPCSAPSIYATASLTHPCTNHTPHCGHPLSSVAALNHTQPIHESYFRSSSHTNVPASVPNTMVPYVASDFTAL